VGWKLLFFCSIFSKDWRSRQTNNSRRKLKKTLNFNLLNLDLDSSERQKIDVLLQPVPPNPLEVRLELCGFLSLAEWTRLAGHNRKTRRMLMGNQRYLAHIPRLHSADFVCVFIALSL
jgi:hypothetical protein